MYHEKLEATLKKRKLSFFRRAQLKDYTTIKIGGVAEYLVFPKNAEEARAIVSFSHTERFPCFVLGGGSNILVSDRGIPGIVLSTRHLDSYSFEGQRLTVEAGAVISDIVAEAAERGLAGIDAFYSMPGSVGGAVWMNARCYGSEIVDVLESVEYCDLSGALHRYTCRREDFDYKISPFQDGSSLILSCTLSLHPEPCETIRQRMHAHREDRKKKGHFAAPSVGSVFKNNRKWGRPSGMILDELKVRGMRKGDAKISDLHANILINAGQARAGDARDLIETLQRKTASELNIDLEPEVLYVGDWESP